jgi:hypothetical protein
MGLFAVKSKQPRAFSPTHLPTLEIGRKNKNKSNCTLGNKEINKFEIQGDWIQRRKETQIEKGCT